MKPKADVLLVDLGRTTAISALVEITAKVLQGGDPPAILAREAAAMLERLKVGQREHALAGFCDELQTFLEAVPRDPGGCLIAHLDRQRRKAA